MIEAVSVYINDILLPQLSGYKVSPAFSEHLARSVETQMRSALQVWNDDAFRKTLLLTVWEEAIYYTPPVDEQTRAFVVLTLRNSPFETLQSVAFADTGLDRALSDRDIVKLTGDAVRFFSRYDLAHLADKDDFKRNDNVYMRLAQAFPVAWNALSALADCDGTACSFPALSRDDAVMFCAKIVHTDEQRCDPVTAAKDGFSDTIEPELQQSLRFCGNNKSPFFVACFKMLSRNLRLVLSVIEYLLIQNASFVTVNCYITNGYAEKRKKFLRAAASARRKKDISHHLSNMNGLSPTHRQILLSIRSNLDA